MRPDEVLKSPISPKVNPLKAFLELMKKENGLRLLIEEYYATRESLLEVLQNAYLKDNRNGAVQAGVLRGFRLAYEELPSAILRFIEEEEKKKEETEEPSVDTPDDTGY